MVAPLGEKSLSVLALATTSELSQGQQLVTRLEW